ncbi:3-methyl-2-oxobutanoate hydroxymethyltransferase [Paratractidigestivibacter sp.]|uniref:3-methyl-2-oxobutanoate hydroxymethyltransferase n=1 Tax=Paratractidigestivibacter sp. TaxID=2847316 RepID=UPI002AC97F37|nr:3-methyl-2-oxobutanoate hydroxymethyltransferase [Paratractidigestivibacter sp.]
MAKNTVLTLKQKVDEGRKVTMVTSYDYTMAALTEAAGIDMILVGDSLGMTMMGYDSTLPVTMDDMVHHTRCVTRATDNTFVVADMPFMSYQQDLATALENAGRLMKEGGAQAVKLEGGVRCVEQIRAMVEAGIPVVGHLGLTPQSVNAFGGFKVQGRSVETARQLVEDALAIEAAGAFCIVLECVPSNLATLITERLTSAFTIGIGAGNGCDGQVLVVQDMLGMTAGGFKPKMVRRFASLGETIVDAFHAYDDAIQSGDFPAAAESYKDLDAEVIDQLRAE